MIGTAPHHEKPPIKRDPAFAIAVHYDPPRNLPRDAPWPGSVNDIAIEGNVITDCAHGISFTNVGGSNVIRGNRVENHGASNSAVGYSIEALPSSTTEFSDNMGKNCAHYFVAPKVTATGNILK